MRNRSFALIIIAIMVIGLALEGNVLFVKGRSSTNESGIIGSNERWTKADSPYTLSGPVAVNKGVTLTIEPGTTVNGGFYIQVNGTLIAKGTITDPVYLGTQIIFTSLSTSWNEQSGSGCVIQYAVVDTISMNGASSKIDGCTVGGLSIKDASPIISNNHLSGISIESAGGSMHARLSEPLVVNNTIAGIVVTRGSPLIINNNLTSSSNFDNNYAAVTIIGMGTPVISRNIIKSRVDITESDLFFPSTRVTYPGIIVKSDNASILDNVINDCSNAIDVEGAATIERNFINGSQNAAITLTGKWDTIIQNNTITNNYVAIQAPLHSTTIVYNNIYNNSLNINLLAANNINAAYNWWATTDTQTINQTIHDNKNDFNIGAVTFTPFLTAPNGQAMPDPNTPMLTTQPTSTPTSPPSYIPQAPEFTLIIAATILLVVAAATILLYTKSKRRKRV